MRIAFSLEKSMHNTGICPQVGAIGLAGDAPQPSKPSNACLQKEDPLAWRLGRSLRGWGEPTSKVAGIFIIDPLVGYLKLLSHPA